MRTRHLAVQFATAFALTAVTVSPALSQSTVTSPRAQFGHDFGEDYFLASYRQLTEYWQRIARESDRVRLERIGTTAEGRPMWMAVISAPENLRDLARYQAIARRLALGDASGEDEARALATSGKAVVWIDGGLHASEVLGSQQLMELVYELASLDDAETQRILRDVIVLAVPANPDGQDLVVDWYMRRADPTTRSLERVPRLYHKYIGHDNNRDFYLGSQAETQAMDSILFRAWHPQIMYNHHQSAPEGTIMFAPPFRDPFNYNFDPLVVTMLDQVGAAMHSRMIGEGKPGTVMRSGATFSTWWNGGLRTTVYFHNMVGLLTETFGNPTPRELPLAPARWLPSGSLPFPVMPQLWHFRQSMDYSRSANRAVLDFASRHREELLLNVYRMARNSIERGSRDNWTLTPSLVEGAQNAFVRDSIARAEQPAATYLAIVRDSSKRDARAYVIPASQADFPTATKFVNALIKAGVRVHRATADFSTQGRSYPAGSYVVVAAQPFRPHVRDMFEPQDHPNDFAYPGGPPIAPYDLAGYTLAYQMGVEFDRILEAITGPFEEIRGFAPVISGRVTERSDAVGYLLSHRQNDAFIAVNRLLAAGHEVSWLRDSVRAGGRTHAPGTYLVRARAGVVPLLNRLATDLGVSFDAVSARPSGAARVTQPRIALWDVYGGSMTSGWTRWLLEQYGFPFQLVFAPDIDGGNLRARFDVLILPDDAELVENVQDSRRAIRSATAPDDAPGEWRERSGMLTRGQSVPALRRFLEEGGTVLAIGSAAALAYELGAPIASALVDSVGAALPRTAFYIPGSVMQMRVDNTHPLAHGMPDRADVLFRNSPSFTLTSGAPGAGVRRIGWYDSAASLRSGWAWGQERLLGTTAVAEIPVGRGRLIVYGPEVLFRAQPHGTFKLFFNGIYYAGLGGLGAWQ